MFFLLQKKSLRTHVEETPYFRDRIPIHVHICVKAKLTIVSVFLFFFNLPLCARQACASCDTHCIYEQMSHFETVAKVWFHELY